jgi:hypothetical protein
MGGDSMSGVLVACEVWALFELGIGARIFG